MQLMTPTDKTHAERFDAIDVRFEEVDRRFDVVDVRFEEVDRRFDVVDVRFEEVDARFEEVDARFQEVDARFQEVDRRFDTLDERLESVNRRFDETDHKIDATREEVVIVKTDMQGIKQEFGEMRKSLDALHLMIHRGSQGVIVALIGVVVAILIKG